MYYKNYARIRDDMGVNDAWVAKESGIAATTLSEWKHSADPNSAKPGYTPKTDKLAKIANVLGVTVDELIKEG